MLSGPNNWPNALISWRTDNVRMTLLVLSISLFYGFCDSFKFYCKKSVGGINNDCVHFRFLLSFLILLCLFYALIV